MRTRLPSMTPQSSCQGFFFRSSRLTICTHHFWCHSGDVATIIYAAKTRIYGATRHHFAAHSEQQKTL
jgi:hypothetical protein